MQVLHRTLQHQCRKNFVTFERDLAHLHLRAFVHLENHFQRRRGHLVQFRIYSRKLPPALRQIFLQDVLGALYFIRIVLRFHRQPDLAFLEPIQNLRRGHGIVPVVFDRADHAALHHHEADDPARAAHLALDANVIEAARVPQRHEVAMNRIDVVLVAALGKDHRPQRVGRNAPHTAKFNVLDHVLERQALRRRCCLGRRRLHGFNRRSLRGGWWLRSARRRCGSLRRCLWNRFEWVISGRLSRRLLRLRMYSAQQAQSHPQSQACEPGKPHSYQNSFLILRPSTDASPLTPVSRNRPHPAVLCTRIARMLRGPKLLF